MRESAQRPLDDAGKGERLKCIFEILNRDKKRYERIKSTRNLSQAEQKEYDDICVRLNIFYEKCHAFIKPRKNGPGRFMVQAYMNWCASQGAIAKQDTQGQASPPGIVDTNAHSLGHERKAVPEQVTFGNQYFSQSVLHTQRGIGYEQNLYRNVGFARQASQGCDPSRDKAAAEEAYKVNRSPETKHFFGLRNEERMDYGSVQAVRNPLAQGPARPEIDPRGPNVYSAPVDEQSRKVMINSQLSDVDNRKFPCPNSLRHVYQGANLPGHLSFAQPGIITDHTIQGFQIKAQISKPLTFSADHAVKNPVYSNGLYSPQGIYGLEEDQRYENATRVEGGTFPYKSIPPQASSAFRSEKLCAQAQMKASQKHLEGPNASHRNSQESNSHSLGNGRGLQATGTAQRTAMFADQGKTCQGANAFTISISHNTKHPCPADIYDAMPPKGSLRATSPRMARDMVNANGSADSHAGMNVCDINIAGSGMKHPDCNARLACKNRPNRPLLDMDQTRELESILSADRPAGNLHSRSEPAMSARSRHAPHRNAGLSLYSNAQRTSNKTVEQGSRNDVPPGPLPVKIGGLDEMPRATSTHKVRPTIAIPARRKSTVNVPTLLSPKAANPFSFEFVCDTRQQPLVARHREYSLTKRNPGEYDRWFRSQPEYARPGVGHETKFPANGSDRHSGKDVLDGSLETSCSKNEKERFYEAISNTYKIAKNFRASILIDPKLAGIFRKSFETFCEEIEIPSSISKEIAIPIMIHLDCILHKTLLVSGMIAQSRATQKMKLEDVELAFKKATASRLASKGKDRELFRQMLEEVRRSENG